MATPIPTNHASFSLRQIADACGGRILYGAADLAVRGVTTDSRAVGPGALFIALRGERYDGHAFIDAALKAGAAALLVERAEAAPPCVPAVVVPDTLRALGDLASSYRRRWRGRLTAITGSAGKTTTKELTAAALRAAGVRVIATSGNLNNLVGVPMSLFLLSDEVDLAVFELGTSAPGEIARLASLVQLDVGLVTSVAAAHTAGIGSLAAVAEEKVSLLKALPQEGVAIYNADIPIIRPLLDGLRANRILSFGTDPTAHVRLAQYLLDPSLRGRAQYEIAQERWRGEARLDLLGEAAAVDAAAALAVVLALLGAERLTAALNGLSEIKPSVGRMRPTPGVRRTLVLDDTYNSNPVSARAALDTARRIARTVGGRVVTILGDMAELGACSSAEHEKLGREVVRSGAEVLIACGPQMAFAAAEAERDAAQASRNTSFQLIRASDAEHAIAHARAQIRERDVVLIKGSRCMAMERIVHALQEETLP